MGLAFLKPPNDDKGNEVLNVPTKPNLLPGAIIYCEAFEIRAVIDRESAGIDAGLLLDGLNSGIPIVADLKEALALPGPRVSTMIYGMAPADGLFSGDDRNTLLSAIESGLNLVSGMREFLGDDDQFAAPAKKTPCADP